MINWPWTKLEKPAALPSRLFPNSSDEFTWEDWREQTREKYPVRFWFQETLPRLLYRGWHPFSEAWYWLRTHSYNKYHIVDLRCPGYGLEYKWGWIDRSEAVLIAPFQLLKEFVEKEFPGHCDWESSPELANAAKEIKELYDWWVTGRVASWKSMDAASPFKDALLEMPVEERIKQRDSKAYSDYLTASHALEQQDDVMLARLIKIRGYLWT